MRKEKRWSSLPYLASIAFCLWFVSFSFYKYMKLWIIHWWNTNQFEILFNPIQEKHIFERFIELEELFLLDEMIKEYPKTYIQKPCIGIHKETIQLVKIHNEYNLDILFHFSKNIICFTILSTYFILNNKELLILNSWVQEFLCNLSDTKKAFFILFITDLALGFHSTRGWEFLIGSVYKDFGLAHRDQILSGLASIFPIILDTIVKYWIFACLNRVSPSLVVIYHSIKN